MKFGVFGIGVRTLWWRFFPHSAYSLLPHGWFLDSSHTFIEQKTFSRIHHPQKNTRRVCVGRYSFMRLCCIMSIPSTRICFGFEIYVHTIGRWNNTHNLFLFIMFFERTIRIYRALSTAKILQYTLVCRVGYNS